MKKTRNPSVAMYVSVFSSRTKSYKYKVQGNFLISHPYKSVDASECAGSLVHFALMLNV